MQNRYMNVFTFNDILLPPVKKGGGQPPV
jgi:hypothetical protein